MKNKKLKSINKKCKWKDELLMNLQEIEDSKRDGKYEHISLSY